MRATRGSSRPKTCVQEHCMRDPAQSQRLVGKIHRGGLQEKKKRLQIANFYPSRERWGAVGNAKVQGEDVIMEQGEIGVNFG